MIGLKYLSEKNYSDLSIRTIKNDATQFIGKKCILKLDQISFQLSNSPTNVSKIIHLLRFKQVSCALQKQCISHCLFSPKNEGNRKCAVVQSQNRSRCHL